MSLLLEYQWVLGVGALGALFFFILWRNRRDIYDFKSGVDTVWHGVTWALRSYVGTLVLIGITLGLLVAIWETTNCFILSPDSCVQSGKLPAKPPAPLAIPN